MGAEFLSNEQVGATWVFDWTPEVGDDAFLVGFDFFNNELFPSERPSDIYAVEVNWRKMEVPAIVMLTNEDDVVTAPWTFNDLKTKPGCRMFMNRPPGAMAFDSWHNAPRRIQLHPWRFLLIGSKQGMTSLTETAISVRLHRRNRGTVGNPHIPKGDMEIIHAMP